MYQISMLYTLNLQLYVKYISIKIVKYSLITNEVLLKIYRK